LIYRGYREAHPVCDQIKEQMRAMIISYSIRNDERLPEVGELSSRLAVNPNMVAQAYSDLAREGYVYYVDGAGIYAADKQTVDERRRQELFGELDQVIKQLSSLSVTAKEITDRINSVAEGDRGFDRSK
jgi:GntR family transcriptional regulator